MDPEPAQLHRVCTQGGALILSLVQFGYHYSNTICELHISYPYVVLCEKKQIEKRAGHIGKGKSV